VNFDIDAGDESGMRVISFHTVINSIWKVF